MLIIVIAVVVAVMVIDVISVGESYKAEQLKKLDIPEESWNKTYRYCEDFAKMSGRVFDLQHELINNTWKICEVRDSGLVKIYDVDPLAYVQMDRGMALPIELNIPKLIPKEVESE